jgi:hypothetical protein
MQRDGWRALGLLTLAALAAAALWPGAHARTPAVSALPVVEPAQPAARAVYGLTHSVPAEAHAAARPLTSSRSACLVSGIVRAPDGTPVPEATVVLQPLLPPGLARPDDAAGDIIRVNSDEHGRFEASPPPGDYALHASDDDRSSALLEPVTLAPGEEIRELDLVLSGSARLSGLVIDDRGDPVEADIEVRLAGHEESFANSSSSGAGAFSMDGIPDGPLTVTATSSETGARVERTLPHPEPDLILRLSAPLGELTIQVVDEGGQPVAHAYVFVRTASRHSGMTTDDDGECSLVPFGPEVEISVESDDGTCEPTKVTVNQQPRAVRIVLQRGAVVRGVVLDAEGAPASGYMQLERLGPRGQVENAGHDGLDEAGAYRFAPLLPGRYRARYATDDDLVADLLQLEFSLTAGQELALQDLRLPRGRRITGVVRGLDGQPAVGVDVELADARETSTGGPSIVTDEDGRFVVEGVVGPVRLRAAGDDGAVSELVVAAAPGDEEVALTLRATGSVDGMLRGLGGKPARVRCAGGLWHDVEKNGQYHIPCAVGGTLEVESQGTTRSYPVEVEEDESTFVELRW